MRKGILFVALALLVVFACGAYAAAKAPRAVRTPRQDGAARPDWWGRPPGDRPAIQGTVKEVSSTGISVQTREGVKSFVVNQQTRVMVRGQRATIADVKVGDPVAVKAAPQPNGLPVALGIMVPKPAYAGEIVSVEGNTLILKSKDGAQLRVLLTPKTRMGSRGYVGTVADLRPGYKASAHGDIADQVMTAQAVQFVPAVAKGTVTAVDGNTITLKAVRQFDVVCSASEATVVMIRPRVGPNKLGTLADVKVGTPANIGFHAGEGGPGTLLWIELLTGM